jgi:hypothetical protein
MATLVKHGDIIKADGDYAVDGIIEGRMYSLGLQFQAGTATMQNIGFAEDEDGLLNNYYADDAVTALTVTATTPRAYDVRAVAPTMLFSIASASGLKAKLICTQIQHGY